MYVCRFNLSGHGFMMPVVSLNICLGVLFADSKSNLNFTGVFMGKLIFH